MSDSRARFGSSVRQLLRLDELQIQLRVVQLDVLTILLVADLVIGPAHEPYLGRALRVITKGVLEPGEIRQAGEGVHERIDLGIKRSSCLLSADGRSLLDASGV